MIDFRIEVCKCGNALQNMKIEASHVHKTEKNVFQKKFTSGWNSNFSYLKTLNAIEIALVLDN